MLDIIIRGGEVVDGSGAPRTRADVALEAGRIVEIGPLEGAEAATVIGATGCVVTPGFVDMHSHLDFTLPLLPTADSLVRQGITTAVMGQCGLSPVPLLDETRAEVLAATATEDRPLPWDRLSTFASYLDTVEAMGISINVAMLVGQGTVRAGVMGFAPGPMDPAQLAQAQAEVSRAMDSGAIGVSTGLIYPPGSYAGTEELIAVTRPAGERGGFYFSHIRGEGDHLLNAVAEAIRIGRETGAAVQVSHFKASGEKNWALAAEGLALIDQARAEGLNVSADMYPYCAGSTDLKSVLPEWAQEGGPGATLARLQDPVTRRAIGEAIKTTGWFRFADWDDILIGESPKARAYEGRYVSDLAAEEGKTGFDWVFDALVETELEIVMIVFQVAEENLRLQLRHPAMMIGTDAEGRAAEGPLSTGKPHPRTYGTYPRVLARYVREEGILSLEEAVFRMTGLPAGKLRWTDRGLVRPGYRADLVVLDPGLVADRATYEAPHQYPAGIHHVIVNGTPVVEADSHTGARPGLILRGV